MYKGMYVAMTGAILRSLEMDNIANNLANVNTTGFKRTTFSSRLYPLMEGLSMPSKSIYPEARAMTYFGQQSIDPSMGSFKITGNPLDLAINGEGFFAIQGKGKIYYTRNGSFGIDRDGNLVTANGQKVLDTADKPIRLNGVSVSITPDGNVFADGNPVGKIKVVMLNNIQHVGDSLFSGDEAGVAKGEIMQGSLEMSNVNPIREMVGIITALRQYETAQKVIQNFEQLAQRAVSDIARV